MSENKKTVLTEEQLEAAAGGGATRNRHELDICRAIGSGGRATNRCFGGGGNSAHWCDHYRRTDVFCNCTVPGTILEGPQPHVHTYKHKCAWGCYSEYEGYKDGSPGSCGLAGNSGR